MDGAMERSPKQTLCWALQQVSTDFKGLESQYDVFSDHSAIKQGINNRKVIGESPKCLEMKQHTSE
jgi:hypothetical protein